MKSVFNETYAKIKTLLVEAITSTYADRASVVKHYYQKTKSDTLLFLFYNEAGELRYVLPWRPVATRSERERNPNAKPSGHIPPFVLLEKKPRFSLIS